MEVEYIVVKALEDGVSIMGMTRGKQTFIHHTEKLNKGEVWLWQFTDDTAAIKIRGKARVFTKHGEIESGQSKTVKVVNKQ